MFRVSCLLACSLLSSLHCSKGSEKPEPGQSGQDEEADKNEPTAPASAMVFSRLFPETIKDNPCELLTPSMVASVAKVPEGELKHRKSGKMCLYSWAGGERGGKASIAFIKTYKSAEEAQGHFEREHKDLSAEDVKAAMALLGEGGKKRLSEEAKLGKKVPSADAVEHVVGGMGKSMGAGIHFEAVSGVGDAASYETTRHENKIANTTIVSYANKLDVLSGNLSFDLSFSLKAVDNKGTMDKEEAIALGKAVLAGLDRH